MKMIDGWDLNNESLVLEVTVRPTKATSDGQIIFNHTLPINIFKCHQHQFFCVSHRLERRL